MTTKSSRKRRPPPHTVVLDTSALWHDDKRHVVAPRFEELWSELERISDLTLVIPETVRGELIFQQTTSASKAADKARAEFRVLSDITNCPPGAIPTPEVIRTQVEARFDRWMTNAGAVVAPMPLGSIDWHRMADAAIWRKPPFTFDSKDSAREKGFRDALILETVLATVRGAQTAASVFVCADALLRTTAAELLAASSGFSAYDSIDSFGSHLRLMKEQLTEKFVSSVIPKAEDYFFTANDAATLFYAANVKDSLLKEHARQFEVDEPFAEFLHSIAPDNPAPWQQVGGQRVRVGKPQFLELNEPSTFVWRTPVRFVRGYTRPVPESSLARAFGPAEHRVLMVVFAVDWSAQVSSNGTHSKGAVLGNTLVSREFDAATTAVVAKYKLNTLAQLDTWARRILPRSK